MIRVEQIEKIKSLANKIVEGEIRSIHAKAEHNAEAVICEQEKYTHDPHKRTASMMWGYLVMWDNDYYTKYRSR